MANVELTFQDKTLSKFLKATEKKHKSISQFKKDYVVLISANVFQDIQDHFLRETGPKKKWEDWSEAYQSFLAKHRPGRLGGKILQDTGRLRSGFIPIRRGGGWRKQGKGILWFNPVRYAKIHDEGGPSKWHGHKVKIPARPFMWLSAKGMLSIEDQTLKFLGV